MGFYIKDNYFIATRITGPRHNFLGLQFCDHLISPDNVVVDVIENKESRVNSEAVKAEVMAGMELISRAIKMDYFVTAIRIYSDDSPTPGVYTFLTRCIVFRLHRFPDDYTNKTAILEAPR